MKHEVFDFNTIKLLHEHLCLDFVNSTANHQNSSEDYLKTYADLVSWGKNVELLSEQEAKNLWAIADQQPVQAAALYEKTLGLREALYHILLHKSLNLKPEANDLDTVNITLREAVSHMRLGISSDDVRWAWDCDADTPEYLLWKVAWEAGELLMSDKVQHVRKCEGCDWLFLDMGRGHKRRWCDMNTCGNRAKARRHYRRTHGN